MAKQTVNIGTVANDDTGDNLRAAGQKINENFTELYTDLVKKDPASPNNILLFWSGTLTQYNAIGTKSPTTIYFID